jgi:hypothetical protein
VEAEEEAAPRLCDVFVCAADNVFAVFLQLSQRHAQVRHCPKSIGEYSGGPSRALVAEARVVRVV